MTFRVLRKYMRPEGMFVSFHRSGNSRYFYIPGAAIEAIGDPPKVKIAVGDGENAGVVAIIPTDGGDPDGYNVKHNHRAVTVAFSRPDRLGINLPSSGTIRFPAWIEDGFICLRPAEGVLKQSGKWDD